MTPILTLSGWHGLAWHKAPDSTQHLLHMALNQTTHSSGPQGDERGQTLEHGTYTGRAQSMPTRAPQHLLLSPEAVGQHVPKTPACKREIWPQSKERGTGKECAETWAVLKSEGI